MSISNFGGTLSSEWSAVMASAMGITKLNFDKFIPFIIVCNILAIIPIVAVQLLNDVNIDSDSDNETENNLDDTL